MDGYAVGPLDNRGVSGKLFAIPFELHEDVSQNKSWQKFHSIFVRPPFSVADVAESQSSNRKTDSSIS